MIDTIEQPVCVSRFLKSSAGSEILYQIDKPKKGVFFTLFRFVNTGPGFVYLNVFLKKDTATVPLIKPDYQFEAGHVIDILDTGEELNLPDETFQIGASVSVGQVVCFTLSGREVVRL